MADQLKLFGAPAKLPEGFRYERDLISAAEEDRLLAHVKELPFKNFEFHGYVGKRRVVSYGWKYDFNERLLRDAEHIPAFLVALRERAAAFARIAPVQLQQVLVTEYEAGAAIGWHRDKAVFGEVIGVSLLSSCTFRLRRQVGTTWERASIIAEPRSVYLLSGPSRTEWEHSIPAVDALRYSITFRSMRSDS